MRTRTLLLPLAAALMQLGCVDPAIVNVSDPRSLTPYPNPFTPADPRWAPQPRREKPQEIVLSRDRRRAYVSLPGTPDAAGQHIAVVDLDTASVTDRVEVGSGPQGLVLHPGGRWLLVLNRYSNFASVIDTDNNQVAHHPPMDFYATEGVFSADGGKLFVSNRWLDAVVAYDVEARATGLVLSERGRIPVGQNPRDLALSGDGSLLAVAALTGLSVSIIDTAARTELRRISVGAPVNDVTFLNARRLVVATTSASTHHAALEGPDTNGDGHPGDGTPNVNFQDLQNEIALYDATTGEEEVRYTSDTICCRDYRDVDPSDVERRGDLLPPREHWLVGGALPEQLALDRDAEPARLFVSYSASNQVQSFEVDEQRGRLSPLVTFATNGHSPHGLVVAGDRVLVVHRLSESLGLYDADDGALRGEILVGDVSGGPFPATDFEIGELVNDVTAPFSLDGDQSCVHCHRENGNIDKAFSMPLTIARGLGLRMTMAYRGSADTRPWFFESAMDETNFRPVINEFARIENFCCSDYTLWPGGAPAGCAQDPPPECEASPNASSTDGFAPFRRPDNDPLAHARPTPFASRDTFYLSAAEQLLGRTRSFGDSLFFEDPITGEREPLPLDFDGVTRSLGIFLLTTTKLLPNPHDAKRQAVQRGRALFDSAAVGCRFCHPAPSFAISTDVNPDSLPLKMGPVVTPLRDAEGNNLDLLSAGFLEAFPLSEMETCEEVCGEEVCSEDASACDDIRDVRLGVPSLRGLWDRAHGMLHHGQARSLREVLSPPGHPALREGEVGRNERDGIVDTHGGTSHLSAGDIEDLELYLLSL